MGGQAKMTEPAGPKWKVKRARSKDGWWAKHPEDPSEDRWFKTHEQAVAHVRSKHIERAVLENPMGAMMTAMSLMATLEQLKKAQVQQLNNEENDVRRDDGGSAGSSGGEEAGAGEEGGEA